MSSGTVFIGAMADNDYEYTEFPGTTAGLQAAIDFLEGGKGKVFIGPGTLETSTAIWIHSYCHLQGSGRGITIIKRASGSITDSDAANSGAVVATSAYGANGTLSNSSATVSDIWVTDLTLDGNYSAFGSLVSGTPHQAGMLIHSCNGLYVRGVTVKNTLRSGYMIAESKNVTMSDVIADTVGQFSLVTTRNGFDFYNFNASTAGYGTDYQMSNFHIYNVGDEAVSLTNVSRVTISNGYIDTCDSVFELQGSDNTTGDSDILIENVTAKDFVQEALLVASNEAPHDYSDIEMRGCTFNGHTTSHDSRIIALEPGNANNCQRVKISNCTFRNINSLDSTTRSWIDCSSNTGSSYGDFIFENCSFYGKSGSVRTADTAFNLLGTNAANVTMRDCYFKNVAGRGIRIHDPASSTTRNIRLNCVTVDTATSVGFQIAGETTGTSIEDVWFDGCIAKDTNTGTGDSGFQVVCSSSSTAPNGIHFVNCRAYKTSGSTMQYGLDLNASTGSMTNIAIINCDFTGVATAGLRPSSVTATNVHFTPRPGRGTDITAAATITMPVDGDVFHVTGNTNITNGITVRAWDNGRKVTLIFEGTPTVSDTGTSKLAGNFVAAGTTNDYDTLTLVCDGTNWTEVARSTN